MRPHLPNCPGHYEERRVLYTARPPGRIMVIEGVPAEVCNFCGDTLYTPETSRTLDRLIQQPPTPSGSVPLYRYPIGLEREPTSRAEPPAVTRG